MKLFITSKVYDTETKTKTEIEEEVQGDLDAYVGKNKVEFKLYTLGCVAAMFFNRHLDYSSSEVSPMKNIKCADCFIISGDGFQGFRLPSPLPPMPYIGFIDYHLDQEEFLKAYRESAEMLGASKIDDAWLEVGNSSIVLRVKTK